MASPDRGLTFRTAASSDLKIVMHHCRSMFVAMGYREKGAIAAMEATSEPLFAKGLKVCIPHASDAGRPLYEALGFEPTNEMRLKLL